MILMMTIAVFAAIIIIVVCLSASSFGAGAIMIYRGETTRGLARVALAGGILGFFRLVIAVPSWVAYSKAEIRKEVV